MSPTTFAVPVKRFGTMDVPTEWVTESMLLGIQQAKRNEGTLLTEADLADDDE